MKTVISVVLLNFLLWTNLFAVELKADLVVVNANVRTMDAARPRAAAFAVVGGRIAALGANEEIRQLIGPNTETLDAGGRLVLPGFNDAHVHFLDGGAGLSSVDLRDAKTPAEFVERIRKFAAGLPKGRWIQNGNWDHENWTPNALPTAAMIDAATPDNPVFINRLDGHMALANSLAMKLAKVDRETKDVAGGEIVRDAAGNPTGVFKDSAMGYIYRVIPDFSFAEKTEYLQAATDYAASLGVTSVQDMSAGTDVGVYQELLRQGRLKTRVYAVSTLSDWQRWQRAGIRRAFGGAMLRVGGLKGFADGSLGSTTAWFYEPYLDAPGSYGLAADEMPNMYEKVKNADQNDLQVMIHAIGDRANDEILKIYERVAREDGARDRRFRIEHAQHLNEGLIKRFAADRVIASMQPYHCIDDGRWAWKRLDEKRLKGTYAFRSLLDAGATLAFGTDWFVAPLNPMFGIYAAATRRTLDDKNPNGWIPEQKITVEEAVRAYTYGSAYAEFQETEKGTLTKGKLADFVVLSDDIFAIDPVKIRDVRVLTTVVDGKVVYRAK
ncbi:MAG: amidohydrolase [Acidobacteria bacterium]|nr:amidohydrolase [Acidobacteriota bacterium]